MYSTFSLSLKPPPYPKEGGAEIVMIIHQNNLQVTGKKMKSYQRHLFIPLINYWSQKKKKKKVSLQRTASKLDIAGKVSWLQF